MTDRDHDDSADGEYGARLSTDPASVGARFNANQQLEKKQVFTGLAPVGSA